MCCCCLVTKSCLTLCHPMDYSPPGSSVHEVFQARIPEWVAMPPPGDFPIPGIVPMSPALAGRFFTTEPSGKSMITFYCCYSVTKLGPTLQPHGLQNTRFPSPSLSLRVCSNSCPPVSVAIQPALWLPPSLLPPSLPAVSLSQHQRLFQWLSSSHQVAKASDITSESVLPVNILRWFTLGLTGLISLQPNSQETLTKYTEPYIGSNYIKETTDYCI